MIRLRRPLLLLVLLLVVGGCTSTQESSAGTWVQGDQTTVIPPGEREPAPTVRAETIDGDMLALADLEGPVLVNFWASWCGPCAREAPHLVALSEQYAGKGAHVVGVNVKDTRVNARSFERDFGVPYPSWFDESAAIAASFGGIGPAALPSTILLDREHRVAVRWFGAVTAMEVAPHLEAMLEEGGP